MPVLMVFLITGKPLPGQKVSIKKLLPDHIKLQYAGGIGFISAGIGYADKKQKLESDLYYGYLPRRIGGIRIHSLSGKISWIPFHISMKHNAGIAPLSAGLLINYNFGKQYFAFDPPNYPYKYYSFPTAINSAIFIGSRLKLSRPKRLSFYYELLVFDRDLISYIGNAGSLQMPDILTLSLGAKLIIH